MRLSRLQNQFFCALLTVTLAFLPMRKAHAIVPLIALGLAATSTAGITVTAADVAGLAIATVGMGALLYLKITAPDGSAIAIPAQDAVLHPSAVVPPPTAPTAPIAAYPTHTQYQNPVSFVWYDTFCNALHSWEDRTSTCGSGYGNFTQAVTACNESTKAWDLTITAKDSNCPSYIVGQVYHYTDPGLTSRTSPICPVGYTATGTAPNYTCVLSVPVQTVVPDNRQDFTRSGQVYSSIANDLNGTIVGIQGQTTSGSDSLSFNGLGSNGGAASVTAIAGPSGTTILIEKTQEYDGNGVPYVKTVGIGMDLNGNPSLLGTNFYPGTLSQTPATTGSSTAFGGTTATGSLPVVAAATGSIAPNVVGTTTAAAAPAIVLPTDYGREITQTQIRDAVIGAGMPADVAATSITSLANANTARDAVVTDIGAMPSAPDPVSPVGFGFNFSPFTPVACTPLTYTFGSVAAISTGSHQVNLDLCPWVPSIQRIGAWAMYLLTAGMLFQMFTRRPEGGE